MAKSKRTKTSKLSKLMKKIIGGNEENEEMEKTESAPAAVEEKPSETPASAAAPAPSPAPAPTPSSGGKKSKKSKCCDDKAYCVKCKKLQSIKDCKIATSANKRKMLKGVCSVCGTKVNKFISGSSCTLKQKGKSKK